MRQILLKTILALCLAAVLFFGSAADAAQSEARAALETTVDQVLTELKKPELKNPASRRAILDRIENIVRTLFSFEDLARLSLGQHRSKLSPDQLTRFTDAFEDLLRSTYLNKLTGYNGETVSYLSEKTIAENRVDIATVINIQGKQVPVSYRMSKKSRWVVYDVIIEGVSMVQNYRNQFNDLFRTGDPEAVISRVRQLAVEAESKT